MMNLNIIIGGLLFAVGAGIAATQHGQIRGNTVGLVGALICTAGVVLAGGTIIGLIPVM